MITDIADAIIEAIDRHKYFVQFDEDSFFVRAESPAEAFKIAQAAYLR
jgi:hypothetical protein